MEPPKALSFDKEVSWTLKEPVLASWSEGDGGRLLSLGLPWLVDEPPQLTLWVGEQANDKSSTVVLQFNVTRRVSKRPKSYDLFMILSPTNCHVGDISLTSTDDILPGVRDCLQYAHGECSTRRLLHLPVTQDSPSRVLMNVQPEGAKPFTGTALHLLLLFRQLSKTQSFDISVGHSDYAKLALSSLGGSLSEQSRTLDVDLSRAYDGNGGIYDNWPQYSAEHFAPLKDDDVGRKDAYEETDISLPPPYCINPLKRSHSNSSPLGKSHIKSQRLLSGSSTIPNTPSTQPPSPQAPTERQVTPSPKDPCISECRLVQSDNSVDASFCHGYDLITGNATNDETRITGTRASTPLPAYPDEDMQHTPSTLSGNAHSSPQEKTDLKPASWKSFIVSKAEALANSALRQNMESFLQHIEYGNTRAEVELGETLEEARTEVHTVRDQGIADIEDCARDCLANFKDDLEILMNNAMEALEGKLTEMNSAAVAVRTFLREFKDLPVAARVTVFQQLAKDRNAEVFLALEKEDRKVLVTKWTGEWKI